MTTPRIIVFDSGLGGLTVYRQLTARLPGAHYLYIADNAAFPYGGRDEDELVARLLSLFDALIRRFSPDICVIACNTASTIALTPLRKRFDVPFVGTVPAIKVAAEQSRSKLFSVLATPGTVRRDYTHDLIERFAADCEVTLVGAENLAALAEQFMRGEAVPGDELWREISPAFVQKGERRTDIIALGCTHFPLLVKEMKKIAPWTLLYIDPAPAIARRTKTVLRELEGLDQGAVQEAEPGLFEGPRSDNRFFYTGTPEMIDNTIAFLQGLGFGEIVQQDIV